MAMQASIQPQVSPGDTCSKVELSLSCSGLKDLDVFSKSDPVVFVYEKRGSYWALLGRTEVIDNNLNPKFSKTLVVDYRFEEVQMLRFVVYDVDNRSRVDDTSKQELIGQMECNLAEIVAAGQQYSRTLRVTAGGPSRGKMTIQTEEVQDSKFSIHMQLSATSLDKKDFFGKSDPMLEIAKAQEGGGFTVVYRSQPVMKNLSPRWAGFDITAQKLCSGDWDRSLKFSVWDWNRSGSHDFIGSCTTTLRDICPERGGQVFGLDLINLELKKKKKKYTNSGKISFNIVKATSIHSFVDFINGGCQINLVCAIDFTASNGKPHLPSSLHYNDPYRDNEYVQAIKSVASVLAPYDSDQLIPVFGFGGRLPPDSHVSHCFPLNFNYERPEVYGVQGILDVYRHALSQADLYGPTNFASFLDKAIEFATGAVTQDNQNYYILVVITDGVICDMMQTVERIVAASKLPLSIVIVGVGGADFTNMEILDADDTPLVNSRGVKMSRDIVQFVPFRMFKNKSGADFSLARETLAEIPGQFVSFMKSKGIHPNPPPLRRAGSTMSQASVYRPAPPGYGTPGTPPTQSFGPPPPGPGASAPGGPGVREEDVQRIVEMFPSMDRAVVRSVLQENRGQLDATITRLLQITAAAYIGPTPQSSGPTPYPSNGPPPYSGPSGSVAPPYPY